jgi:tetratricopeptide (TPR) repeat protein
MKLVLVITMFAFLCSPAFGDKANDYVHSGIAKAQKGDLDGAVADFSKAIQLTPDYAEAYYSRGVAKREKGDYNGAIADWDKAIQLKPDYAYAYNNRGNAKSEKGDYNGAIADLDKAIQLKPNDAEPYYNRGNAKSEKGDYNGAIADYDKAIHLKPNYADACNRLAWLLATCPRANLRDGKKAVEDATKACDLTAWKNLNELSTLAAAYAESGDFDDAIKWETKYLQAPNLRADYAEQHKKRLALYRDHQPYHAYK